MRLYIAEKPSLGRAIAAVLPKPQKKHEGYIELANGDCVTWCIGHLLELAEPEQYDERFKQWRLDTLPIVPEQWQWRPKRQTSKQLTVIKKLAKQASQLVHAGDPDREGQLLVDLVIEHCRLPKAKMASIQRLLISDLNPPAVRKALDKLRGNGEFTALSDSARTRSHADWLYGINLTRAYSVRGRQQGYPGVLSVGRVQTPLLGLVVRRDLEIANFVAKPYYQVRAELLTEHGERFSAMWQPSEACLPYQDEDGRVLLRKLAEHVARKITQQNALVDKLEAKDKQQAPPLPYNLSSLQIDAAKRFGMSAKQVLEVAQSLYERHTLITYPRSDSRHLPRQQHAAAPKVVAALANNHPALGEFAAKADTSLKSKAWNDAKVDAHHAIIPTEKQLASAKLSDAEQKIYGLIARQYLAQFYPHYRYREVRAEIRIEEGLFLAKARQDLALGWKVLFQREGATDKQQSSEQQSGEQQSRLPALSQGQQLLCEQGVVEDKLTQPPKPFSDATLLAAMTGIARFVQSKELKKVLKDTDGLGTEATRAGIIELLFKRGFLQRQGKQIHASEAGKALIGALPEACSLPDMTALWEQQLEAIASAQHQSGAFMTDLKQQLQSLLQQPVSAAAFSGLTAPSKPRWSKGSRKGSAKGTSRSGGKRRSTGSRSAGARSKATS
ncbi:DNA topoisomerase III [Aliagarivorans taiwanensis]|uniref:DNA topoisomerase III n=1 Tax=Aliagarivorans taiwanensis TaxID=561966 RepID=UPI0003FEDF84|nr:DNA topoisomerase III [Aliagarivorans taiwanensis]